MKRNEKQQDNPEATMDSVDRVEHRKTNDENPVAVGQPKRMPPLREADIKNIQKMHDDILQHLEDHLSLEELSSTCCINEFKLKYGFKQLYATTIFGFIRRKRLEKAKRYLQHTDMPVKEVARKTGFKSLSHFSRIFKKWFGN
jgi:AraC-like DNA-binding protein